VSPYMWGLSALVVVAYVVGTYRPHRLISPPSWRALQRRQRERGVQELLDWLGRRHVRVVIQREGRRLVLGEVPLRHVGRALIDMERESEPLGAADRRFTLYARDHVVCELAGVTAVEPVAELARFVVSGGAA
jgi:hypothetical protein